MNPEAQGSRGSLLHFQPPRIGEWVEKCHRLFVVEGTLTAAEFYASINGRVASFAAEDALISDLLVALEKVERPD